jgi:L-arabinokinase
VPERSVVFYISGHGFGHASRDIEIMNALGARDPSIRLVVCTSAPRWLFDLTARTPYAFRAVDADTGIVQRDSLNHDIAATLGRAAAFYRDGDRRVEEEAAFLSSLAQRTAGGPCRTVVLGDIPPLAFAAADRAGLPSYATGNFTWDWIYEGYEETEVVAPGIVETMRGAYARACAAWRLPMHGGFESCRTVVDVPFVARRSRRQRDETRRALGLPLDRPLVLTSFGGYGLNGLPLERVDCLDGYGVVVTETSARDVAAAAPSHPNVFTLQENEIYGQGLRYEDLVKAVDVVLTKPGYGIIAECLANDTALVYTSRGRFREYDVLVRAMPDLVRCRFIPQDDLFGGRWGSAIDAVLAQPPPPSPPPVDGAEAIAERIVRALE